MQVQLPVHVDLASAEARITAIECYPAEKTPRRVKVSARPSIARVRIAEPVGGDIFSTSFQPADIVRTRLLRVRAYADTDAGNPEAKTLTFNQADFGGNPKTVETDSALRGALSSAIANLDYDIELVGLQLLSPVLIQNTVAGLVSELARPVDELVFSLTSSLGLGLGEADIWVHAANCNPATLVQ